MDLFRKTDKGLNVGLRQLWFTFAVSVTLFLSILMGVAPAQTPGRKIPANPDFASPTQDTPNGVEVNSASLIENANSWNGRVIAFTGEAIGEAMVRGTMAWIHLNDDAYMLKNIEEGAKLDGYNSGHAVWVSADLAKKIYEFGDFKHKGDMVKGIGTFNATCPQHGGDMDIHASSIEIVRAGHVVQSGINPFRAILAGGLLSVAFVLHRVRTLVRRRHGF